MSSVRTITIPEKHYNNDPAKAKVHDMLGEMLDTTLLTFRKPSEIKVLHFAGIDAQETKAVYLSRGIPPQNITTLERDPEIAKVQESLGLGIVVINKTIEEYVKEQTSNNRRLDFNVVSLDFTSPLTKSGIGFMSYIKDKIMHNYLLFHSANLLRREANSRSAYSRISSVCVEHNNANLDKPKIISDLEEFHKSVEDNLKEVTKIGDILDDNTLRKDFKIQLYPNVILSAISDTTSGKELEQVARFALGNQFKDFENITLETFKNRYSSLTELLNAVIADPYGAILAYEIQKLLYNVILQKLKQLGYPLRPAAALLGHAIMLAAAKIPSLSEKNTKGYSYVSESGSPMVGCISFLSRPRYVHQAALAVAKECGFPTEFKIRDIAKFNREFNNFAIKFDSSSPKVAEAPEVVFLGNSSRPVLTKRRFIEALEEGLSIEQIKEKFRGWSAKPLAQWKAHHTMGTYDMTRQDEQETITVKCDGKDVERINKDEALELLSAGIPPKEIFDAYPTSFTVGQLRAFKAHYSMGTYIIDQT